MSRPYSDLLVQATQYRQDHADQWHQKFTFQELVVDFQDDTNPYALAFNAESDIHSYRYKLGFVLDQIHLTKQQQLTSQTVSYLLIVLPQEENSDTPYPLYLWQNYEYLPVF